MHNLNELIETMNSVCTNLERASAQETKFCYDVCHRLEQMSWEMYRTINELKEINEHWS